MPCTHTDQIKNVAPTSSGCRACLASGDTWVHLRVCLTCGTVACCDSSKNQHAKRHAEIMGHPIVASLEPGEQWRWCYVDQEFV